MRRAFSPESFASVPAPAKGDWIAAHWEPKQTFDDFIAEKAARPNADRRRLYLLPLGEFQNRGPALETLRRYLQAFFGVEAVLMSAATIDAGITSRVNEQTGARQLLTKDILARLSEQLPSDGFALLAVTMEDLYPAGSWNFVFGQASPKDRVGVFSFARYDPRFYGQDDAGAAPHLLRRSLKVLTHEMGHMFGIRHCRYFACNMNGSNHIAEADSQPMSLCPVCLRKLHHSVGFDPAARYAALEAIYAQAGFQEEAAATRRMRMLVEGL